MAVSLTFHVLFVQISFSSVPVAAWTPLGKELLTWLSHDYLFSLYSDYLFNSYFPF